MNRLKFPINSYEVYFLAMATSLILYIVVSLLTYKEPFNLDRMLHRGKYAVEGEKKIHMSWTVKNVFSKLIGITPEYSKGDRIIARSVFAYSFIYKFFIAFLLVVIWNMFTPWEPEWWGHYFLITQLLIPGVAATITCVWFTAGSSRDLVYLFRDLKNRVANPLDNGMVDGHVAISEKARFGKLEQEQAENADEKTVRRAEKLAESINKNRTNF